MSFLDNPFATPVSPFQRPVPLVLIPPEINPDYCVTFRHEWVPYIVGALQTLLLQATWKTNNPDLLGQQQQFSEELISIFLNPVNCAPAGVGAAGGDENMIRQNPDNPCLLETSVDGTNWCVWADLSKCLGTPNQTGEDSKQPPPAGGVACFNTELQANGRYWIPVPVNAGDVIDVTFSDGLWGDPASPLPRCPDGDIFVGQGCVVGTEFTHAGDPMPAKPHASIVINVDGVFYAQVDGPVTVPGGVSNVMAWVQGNFDVLNNASGSATIKVCVTNNQSAPWSSVLDLSLNSYAAHITPTVGVWSAGLGWTGTPSGSSVSYLQLDVVLGSCTITLCELTYDIGPITATAAVELFTDGAGYGTPLVPPVTGTNLLYTVSATRGVTSTLTPLLDAGNSGSSSTTLKKVRLTGTGTKPAWLP